MTYTTADILTTIRRLTSSQLKEARAGAASMTISEFGGNPKQGDFERKTRDGKSNQSLVIMIAGITIAAAAISIFRTFSAGRQHYIETTGIVWQSYIAGIAMFVMAELAVIVFATAAIRVFEGRKGPQAVLSFLTLVAGSIAVVGNIIIAQPAFNEVSVGNTWAWIETLSPTIFTVASVYILGAIEASRDAATAMVYSEFTAALETWKTQTAKPETLPGFMDNFRQEIKESLIEHNNRRGGKNQALRIEMVATMTASDWVIVVERELPASMISGESATTASPKSSTGSVFSPPVNQPHSPSLAPTSKRQ